MANRVAQIIAGIIMLGIAMFFLSIVFLGLTEGFLYPLAFPMTVVLGLLIIPILWVSFRLFKRKGD